MTTGCAKITEVPRRERIAVPPLTQMQWYVSEFESIPIRIKPASPANFSDGCGRPSTSIAHYPQPRVCNRYHAG